ncbi:MAG: DUF4846 domain-containing protein [Intestinibacter sp.]|uniref:DUF4846 domain-containing protein n=1 Tax=Intestinibacter sp. TaxID=1965304 RepID=UPI002A801750|nr:DUF4846 domain-containing protein [Intestinibacter sp.]MDY4575393.1 DUF4846 domain-containing protein [Intestinibacter sp.]
MKFLVVFVSLVLSIFVFTGCSHSKNQVDNSSDVSNYNQEQKKDVIVVNKEENILKDRYEVPEGYERVSLEENSFGEFLRNSKLEDYGEKVKYYDGRVKDKPNVYDSVFDVDIGDRDLHQCADAVMLLRAEYLYQNKRYDDISFHFVDGFNAKYSKWRRGYRISVGENSSSYYKATGESNTYETFRKYMDIVFAYSSTLSLDEELKSVDVKDMQIGDVFIKGGSPGHCAIVVDMAENKETGEKVFMLAQSYMPAQQTQLLINPNDQYLSPWYSLDFGENLKTPEWTFTKDQLKRF